MKTFIENFEFSSLTGCEAKSLVEKIGYKNIAILTDSSELIKKFDNETLLDAICNDNERDTEELIREMYQSELSLNCGQTEIMTAKMDELLKGIFSNKIGKANSKTYI